MSSTRVARRYAAGLWDYALSVKEQDTIVKEMRTLIEVIEGSKDFRLFLKSPVIETNTKIKIAKEILKSFSRTTQNFFTLLLKHNREINLLHIAEQLIQLHDNYNGVQRVTIISAIPLDKDSIDRIIKAESRVDQLKAEINNIVDPSIVGGYILRLSDYQLDASVKTKLENIKKTFKEKVF